MDWKKALAIFGPATLTVLIALINTGNWAYLLLLALTPLALWWAGFDFSQLLAEESYPYYDLGPSESALDAEQQELEEL